MFAGHLREASGGSEPGRFYRPLQLVSYRLDHYFWRLDPFGYHLGNLLWHLAAVLLLYALVAALFADAALAFWTALLFAAHPVHTEAVAYVSGRAEMLTAVFLWAAFLFYLRHLEKPGLSKLGASLACFATALFCKESALVFPAILFFYFYVFGKRFQKSALLFLAPPALYAALRLSGALHLALPAGNFISGLERRLPEIFAALAADARVLVAPFGLHMEHGLWHCGWGEAAVWAGMAVFVVLCAATFLRRRPLVSFAAGWFLIFIFPVSNVFRLNASFAEHWLYVPSVGFFVLLAAGLLRLARTRKGLAMAAGAGVVAFYSVLTVLQNQTWKDPVSFFERTIRYSDSARLHYKLGLAYEQKGRTAEAMKSYEEAIEMNPSLMESYSCLGTLLRKEGRALEAAALFQKGLRVQPHAGLFNNLGNVYREMGRAEDAAACYSEAARLDPEFPDYSYNLGNMHLSAGRFGEAVDCFKRALRLHPQDGEIYQSLAVAYFAQGHVDEALRAKDEAIKCGFPVRPELLKLLGEREREL